MGGLGARAHHWHFSLVRSSITPLPRVIIITEFLYFCVPVHRIFFVYRYTERNLVRIGYTLVLLLQDCTQTYGTRRTAINERRVIIRIHHHRFNSYFIHKVAWGKKNIQKGSFLSSYVVAINRAESNAEVITRYRRRSQHDTNTKP